MTTTTRTRAPHLTPSMRSVLVRLHDGAQTAHQPPTVLRALRERGLLDLGRLTPLGVSAAEQIARARSAH